MSTLGRRLLFCALLVAVIQAGPGRAQGLTGQWTITAETQPQAQVDAIVLLCQWQGVWDLTDTAGAVSGTVTLDLTSGDMGCPDPMTAMLSGKSSEGTVSGTIGGPNDNLGEVSFRASVTSQTVGAQPAAGTTASGSFSVVGGSFAGNAGTFAGSLAPVMPAVPPIGMAALLLLLFVGGSFLLFRRQRA